MQLVNGSLYWQVQGVVNDQERYVYEVDTSGVPNALTLLQTVQGSLNDAPPQSNDRRGRSSSTFSPSSHI